MHGNYRMFSFQIKNFFCVLTLMICFFSRDAVASALTEAIKAFDKTSLKTPQPVPSSEQASKNVRPSLEMLLKAKKGLIPVKKNSALPASKALPAGFLREIEAQKRAFDQKASNNRRRQKRKNGQHQVTAEDLKTYLKKRAKEILEEPILEAFKEIYKDLNQQKKSLETLEENLKSLRDQKEAMDLSLGGYMHYNALNQQRFLTDAEYDELEFLEKRLGIDDPENLTEMIEEKTQALQSLRGKIDPLLEEKTLRQKRLHDTKILLRKEKESFMKTFAKDIDALAPDWDYENIAMLFQRHFPALTREDCVRFLGTHMGPAKKDAILEKILVDYDGNDLVLKPAPHSAEIGTFQSLAEKIAFEKSLQEALFHDPVMYACLKGVSSPPLDRNTYEKKMQAYDNAIEKVQSWPESLLHWLLEPFKPQNTCYHFMEVETIRDLISRVIVCDALNFDPKSLEVSYFYTIQGDIAEKDLLLRFLETWASPEQIKKGQSYKKAYDTTYQEILEFYTKVPLGFLKNAFAVEDVIKGLQEHFLGDMQKKHPEHLDFLEKNAFNLCFRGGQLSLQKKDPEDTLILSEQETIRYWERVLSYEAHYYPLLWWFDLLVDPYSQKDPCPCPCHGALEEQSDFERLDDLNHEAIVKSMIVIPRSKPISIKASRVRMEDSGDSLTLGTSDPGSVNSDIHDANKSAEDGSKNSEGSFSSFLRYMGLASHDR